MSELGELGELIAWVDLRDNNGRYLGRLNYALATVEIRHRGDDIIFPLDVERIAAKSNQHNAMDNTQES